MMNKCSVIIIIIAALMVSKANSLQSKIHEWEEIGAPKTVLSWIKDGVRIPFREKPVSFEYDNKSLSKQQVDFIDSELHNLLSIGAISKSDSKPHCVSPISCVPKKNGKFRLIVDLRNVNSFCSVPSFSNENINTVCDIIEPNDTLFTIDLKNGFYHINVHSDDRTFLGFKWRNQYFVWNVLPFGLSASPFFFQKTLRPVVQYCRELGLRLVFYVDDCILMVRYELAIAHKEKLLQILNSLGWIVNMEKS